MLLRLLPHVFLLALPRFHCQIFALLFFVLAVVDGLMSFNESYHPGLEPQRRQASRSTCLFQLTVADVAESEAVIYLC